MKTKLMILSIIFGTLLACSNPNRNKESNSKYIDNRDIPIDNNDDTTVFGNDTLGTGDGQGPDHFEP